MQTDNVKRHLVVMERIINLNTYQKKQALYRNFEPITGLSLTLASRSYWSPVYVAVLLCFYRASAY